MLLERIALDSENSYAERTQLYSARHDGNKNDKCFFGSSGGRADVSVCSFGVRLQPDCMYYWAHSEKILQKLEILPVSKPAWPDESQTDSAPTREELTGKCVSHSFEARAVKAEFLPV